MRSAIYYISSIMCPEGDGEAKKEQKAPKYPGNDPSKSPGKDWEWRGPDQPG